MKKILFSLLMLCSITAAWAGDGDGSKDHPYTGEQNATELKSKLKVGDYLAYDCVIDSGAITVYDDSLMVSVVHGWSTWAVGDPIDKSPFSIYKVGSDYCSLYSPEERKDHTFKITGFIEVDPEEDDQNKIAITGHYSGVYFAGKGAHEMANNSSVYVEDSINRIRVHNVKELTDAINEHGKDSNAIIQLMADIDMSDYKTPHEEDDADLDITFNAQLCGYYKKRYEDGEFVTDKNGDIITYTFELKHQKRPLFGVCEKAKIQGIQFTEADLSSMVMFRSNLVCAGAYGTEFTDVTIFGCRYSDEFFMKKIPGVSIVYNVMFGKSAGQVATRMENCTVKRVNVIGSTFFMRGSGVGNIVGTAKKTTFEDCFVDAGSTIYVEDDADAYVGGLVGQATDCTFSECVNMSTVCGSEKADNIGGVCGESTGCTFEHCYNGGVLAQTTMETWITTTVRKSYDILSSIKTIAKANPIGNAIKNIQIEYANYCNITGKQLLAEELSMSAVAEVEGDAAAALGEYVSGAFALYAVYTVTFNVIVAFNSPDEIGGISSAAHGCTFNRCMNAGRIFCRDAWAGGIVGRSYSNDKTKTRFDKCINIGYVQGDELAGGIVGAMEDDCEILNCLNTSTIDCRKDTYGPIYGKKTDGTTVRNCFAMAHDAEDHTDGLKGGNGVTKVSYRDVLSGRVAYELNNSTNSQDFRQNVGRQPYPTFFRSKVVEENSINNDIDAVFKVADLGGFVNTIFNQYANIELADDIDFNGSYFTAYREETPFRGSIDGKGNSLKNIFVESVDLGSEISHAYAMIGAAEGATFKNLSLESCTFNHPTLGGSGFVFKSKGCKYENVCLSGNTRVSAHPTTGGLIWESRGDSLINCGIGQDCWVEGVPYEVIHIDVPTTPVGGVATQAFESTFIDCYNRGTVKGGYVFVGGIVAECENSKFIHCVNEGHVVIENNFRIIKEKHSGAGIVAEATNSTFYRCANYGKYPMNVTYDGGIVAYGNKVTINSCLNIHKEEFIPPIIHPDDIDVVEGSGGIIGMAVNGSLVENCASRVDGDPLLGVGKDMHPRSGNNYMKGFETGDGKHDWIMQVEEPDFYNGKVCYWLNNGQYSSENAWQQNGSELTLDGDGSLVTIDDIVNEDRSDVFKISTPEDLIAFADHVNSGNQFACAILMNDINMAGKKFTPIGKNEDHKHFRGIINGRGHTIDSLKVQSDQPVGLVGTAHVHAEVHNVIIGKGSEFVNTGSVNGLGDAGAGGILGRVQTGWKWGRVNIENCGSYADIKVNKHGGGIFGLTNPGEGAYFNLDVRNCFSMGTITAYNGNSALLCGYSKNSGRLYNCWSGGQLRTSQSGVKPFSTENDFGYWELLIGYDMGITTVRNCYVIDPEHNVDLWDKNQHQGGVDTLTTTDLASGKLAYILNDSINDVSKQLVWEQNLGTDGNPTFGNKGIYHTRKVTNQYGTLCLPYYLRSNDKISFYYIAKNDIKDNLVTLKFKYIDEVPPGLPILFRIKDYDETTDSELLFDWDGSNGFASTPGSYSGYWYWNMFGTYKKTVLDETTYYPSSEVYYLSNGEIRNAKKTTIAPFRSFFWLPDVKRLFPDYYDSVAIQFILEDEDGTTTAIELDGMQNAECRMQNVYNIQGQKVDENYRGIVIKNGKKVLVK